MQRSKAKNDINCFQVRNNSKNVQTNYIVQRLFNSTILALIIGFNVFCSAQDVFILAYN